MTRYRDVILRVHIDVPRWSFIKHGDDGRVDFVSPLPSPFNYGHVPGTLGEDGDAEDALVLGPRLSAGTVVDVSARARVDFIDGGRSDPKWVCSQSELRPADLRQVATFFRIYARLKRVANVARGRRGRTQFVGWK